MGRALLPPTGFAAKFRASLYSCLASNLPTPGTGLEYPFSSSTLWPLPDTGKFSRGSSQAKRL